MQNDKSNITIGLPKAGGALYWAPTGAKLPENASDSLGEEFVNLGYVTEDGVTISIEEDGDDIQAWGPEAVLHAQSGYTVTAEFNLLETSRVNVLQFIYGKDNVKIEDGGALSWTDTGASLPRGVFVCDTLQNNGGEKPRVKRQVFGDAQFTDRSGEHVYNNSDPLAYPIVLTAYKFEDGGKQVYTKNFLSAPVKAVEEEEVPGEDS